MKTKVAAIMLVAIAITASLGASAFTTGTVTRSSDVNVVTDDVGLIGLSDGTSGDLVTMNSTGALDINFTTSGADGVNTAAHFELGDPASPTTQTAFNVTNNDDTSHDLTIEYTGAGGTADADENIQFQVYNGTGSKVATVSEETTSQTITGAASGATYYVVVVVDTHGLDSTADLSGTLKISA